MKRTKTSKSATSANSSILAKLSMLREFVNPDNQFTESDLSACLRQCGYNVQLAAERLMTGQFQIKSSTFFSLSAAVSPSKNKKKNDDNDEAKKPAAKKAKLTATAMTVPGGGVAKIKSNNAAALSARKPTPSSSSFLSARKITPAPVAAAASSTTAVTPSPAASLHQTMDGSLLLCTHWVVGVCTTKHGAAMYNEKLEISHTQDGPTMVRFRGPRVEGTLPSNLAALLTPLLRYSVNDEEESSTTSTEDKLLTIECQALMEVKGLPIGGEVPVALKIYISNPRAFFGLFDKLETANNSSAAAQYFGNKKKSAPKTSKKKALPAMEAAFGLLQWAEYGEQYHFEPPKEQEEQEGSKEEAASNETSDEDDEAYVGETQLDTEAAGQEEEASEWAKELVNDAAVSVDASLPEADDPEGFKDGVELRPYQKQALHWMLNRESGDEHREALEKELELLSELARNASKTSLSDRSAYLKDDTVMCGEPGPVLVSPSAAEKSRTLDGVLNPVRHPLWQRRFLATPDMEQAISFYVNELTGMASAEPPNPPSHCVGGCLADAMGLGKTVMLLALILKSNELATKESCKAGGTTLVVAPLSLISQWEEELATKTSLRHQVYYGDSSKGRAASFENVDVVVTTYGTVQAELQMTKKNPSATGGIIAYDWLRVILDEAHCIKNNATLVSRACCMLKAEKRWCVTGTPIQNSLQDVYALLKFLRHEPWSEAGFWKAAITNAADPQQDSDEARSNATAGTAEASVAQSRVRRLLAPLILRRTKDSLNKDGKPILTLPPVETATVNVELTPAERDFYNSLMTRSQTVFEGFLKDGTASKSWFAIFSLLHRLRQACDHVALTVKAHLDDGDWNASNTTVADSPGKEKPSATAVGRKSPGTKDSVDDAFLDGLLEKFHSKQTGKENIDSSQDDDTEQKYASKVAHALDSIVNAGATHVEEECALCLDAPKIHDAVLTPCAHVFCRECLLRMLRDAAQQKRAAAAAAAAAMASQADGDEDQAPAPQRTPFINTLDCPDGECPICKEHIEAKRIIALSKSDGGRTTTSFLTDTKNTSHSIRVKTEAPTSALDNVARQTLENALRGADSSKLKAVVDELYNVWEKDPGSKVLVFSQFLGFLDLMEGSLRKHKIPFGRLDGRLSLKERVQVLEKFRDSKTNTFVETEDDCGSRARTRGSVLLVSMKAGGVGINLTAASSVFIVDPWWNAAVEDQCINRIHRIGQTAEVVRVRKFVVQDSVEERIVELQRRKQDMASDVLSDRMNAMDGGGANSRPTLDDLKLIFRG